MSTPNLEPCGIGGCTELVCIICKCHDCKWPGACDGKCRECGGKIPTRAEYWAGDTSSPPSSTCSTACTNALWNRGVADGTVVSLSDLTPEQVNEEFNKIGLALAGVGERKPS